MKTTGITASGGLWDSPNSDATNSSGFSGLPGGYRLVSGNYSSPGLDGAWWTSTQFNNNSFNAAWFRQLRNINGALNEVPYQNQIGLSIRCVRDQIPTVITSSLFNLTTASVKITGNIVSADSVTVRGVCWSLNPNPTILLSTKTEDGTGNGSFESFVTDLQPSTTYYVRSYAKNGHGTGYGNELSFTTQTVQPGQLIDIDGNIYDTVEIGTQVWLKQNLKTTKYRNGDAIPTGLSDAAWSTTTIGAYSIYDNLVANDSIYGKLYNWYAVSDPRGLCPTGWHVPDNSEWTTLRNYLGGAYVAGEAMKSITWGGTNSSNFTSLPAGYKDYDGIPYHGLGTYTVYWSSTSAWWTFTEAHTWNLYDGLSSFVDGSNDFHFGSSVRCLKD